MIAFTRDAAWTERLRAVAARGGWPFALSAAASAASHMPDAEFAVVVLDRSAAEGSLTRAIAVLRGRYASARLAVALSESEMGADGVAGVLACGADDVLVKSWPDARLFARLSAARDAGLAAAVRVSADGALRAERRSHRVFARARGRWRELPVPAAEFAILWQLLQAAGAPVSRERMLGALRDVVGREVEVETVARRALSLRRALSPWAGRVETVRGGFYRLAAPRPRPARKPRKSRT
jgi:DNA-binding response OmpR family regulator